DWFYLGSLYRHQTFQSNGESMLVLPYNELGPDSRYNNTRTFFSLYNLTQDRWVYQRAPLSLPEDGGAPSLMPIVDGNRVYMTSLNSIGCFDLMTGERIWQRRVSEVHMGALNMIQVGDRLVVNC